MTGGRGIGVGEEVGVIVAVGEILVGVFVAAGLAVLGEPQDDIMIMPIAKITSDIFLFIGYSLLMHACGLMDFKISSAR